MRAGLAARQVPLVGAVQDLPRALHGALGTALAFARGPRRPRRGVALAFQQSSHGAPLVLGAACLELCRIQTKEEANGLGCL